MTIIYEHLKTVTHYRKYKINVNKLCECERSEERETTNRPKITSKAQLQLFFSELLKHIS